jgi:type I restriction enzyme S subunit
MSEGWEIKKLGEVCENLDSKRIPITQSKRTKGDIPYYGASGIVDYVSDFIFDEDLLCVSEDGANLLARTYPIAFSISGKTWVNNHAHVLRFKNFSTQKFVEIYLNSIRVDNYVSGMAQPKLNQAMLNKIPIPVPPLPEQQRIVSVLDEAFAAIAKAKANAEQNLRNAKELFESYLRGIISNGHGWEKKTLAQISSSFGRGKSKHRPRNWEGLYGGQYPFIQTEDIRNCNHYITEYTQTYNEVGLTQSKLWPSGTICITIAANIAETGILTFDACFPDSVIGIVVNEELADRDFVEYLLQSFKVRIQSLGKGSAQANINMGTFENELFPIPPLEEQKAIVERLNQLALACSKLEEAYTKKLSNLDDLKKSVLQKAFAGELKTEKMVEV